MLPARVRTVLALAALGLSAQAQLPVLHTSGRSIVNPGGSVVGLHGVNLGGLFVMEGWMTPLDSGGLPDTYSVIQKLDARFGIAAEQALIAGFQQDWINEADLDNIRNTGFNTVRVPLWWGQFYPLGNVSNGSFRSDAFNRLDWLVNACAARGLYVILDMHGAVGGQSNSDSTGQQNSNGYWSNGDNQGNTAYLWWQIANHYRGNGTVAGYDLLNEPFGAPSNDAVISAYKSLYNTVRSADPDHMIFLEATWGYWNWSMLPDPASQGWTNVVYSTHEYQYNASQTAVEQGAANQVNDFNNHANYNVPGYIGEFNDFGYGAGTWQSSVNAYTNAGLSWTMWSYKNIHGSLPDAWGLYDPNFYPAKPNVSTDAQSTIAGDWAQWTTANAFGFNASLGFTQGGSSVSGLSGAHVLVPQNATGLALDDWQSGTGAGNQIDIWPRNGSGAQSWVFNGNGVSPAGSYNIAVSYGAYCATASGTNDGSLVNLQPCNGSAAQAWAAVPSGAGYALKPASNPGQCLDVQGFGTSGGTLVQVWTCANSSNQQWALQ